jgi:transcriptional antiterminator NusG
MDIHDNDEQLGEVEPIEEVQDLDESLDEGQVPVQEDPVTSPAQDPTMDEDQDTQPDQDPSVEQEVSEELREDEQPLAEVDLDDDKSSEVEEVLEEPLSNEVDEAVSAALEVVDDGPEELDVELVDEIPDDDQPSEVEKVLEEPLSNSVDEAASDALEVVDDSPEELDVELIDEIPDDEPTDLTDESIAEEDEPEGDEIPEPEQETLVIEPIKDDGRAWYVVHCYSGNEDKVRHNIVQRIESMAMDDYIFDVVVPTEDEVNIKNGERQTVEKKVFPGYILVNMILTEESWYMVRNTPGVTGFVGMGNDPTPLQPEEVARILKRMESESPRINITFRPGERVRIVDGPFEDFYGKVSEIDMERATVRVMVNFFGRETPVELDFLQVEEA